MLAESIITHLRKRINAEIRLAYTSDIQEELVEYYDYELAIGHRHLYLRFIDDHCQLSVFGGGAAITNTHFHFDYSDPLFFDKLTTTILVG